MFFAIPQSDQIIILPAELWQIDRHFVMNEKYCYVIGIVVLNLAPNPRPTTNIQSVGQSVIPKTLKKLHKKN
jgi:hypothetical protein